MPETVHRLDVPLDHHDPAGATISVAAREVWRTGGEHLPYLVFLQGGPGNESPRTNRFGQLPWIDRALREHRVLLLDQRGTGLSTPVGPVERIPGGTAEEKAAYLTHFRADSIVRDCEALRRHLGVERWSLLGQSFGGFTSLTYLSLAASALAGVMITGGLSPVGLHPDAVYAATYSIMRRKSERYWSRHPGDRDRWRAALELAEAGGLRLPGGDPITPRLLRSIGSVLGRDGGDQVLHHLLELDPRSPAFTWDVAGLLPFGGRNPIYAVLHESSYSDGFRTSWSAHRVLPDDMADDLTLLSGEHIAPWHFVDTPDLRPYAEVAELLAEHPWPRLYDEEALRAADVPVAATVYVDDAFVDPETSMRTAALLARVEPWITNEHEHSGLRTSGTRVMDRMLELVRVP